MENIFGPWTRRMAMLLPTNPSAVTLSRRSLLGIVAGGIFAFLVPTIRDASAQGESKEKKAIENKGRVFINANLRYKPEGNDQEERLSAIIAIDPETGKWQKITDTGYAGRVSPDQQ